MKQYKQLLNELPSKTVVFAFGRFNPPTTGHELLMRVVQRLAQQKRADHVVFASKTQDAKKNPLSVDKKVKYLKIMFPRMNFVAADQEVRTFIEAAAKLSKMGYKNAIMVAGSDRVAEFKRLLNTYNGKEFNFETIDVVSAGQRDPDADNATGMSATKMRSLATKGDFEGFKKGLPTTMREIDARRLMNDIRMGMNLTAIREEIELPRDSVRERYFRGDIFNEGDLVKNANKEKVYEVVKRGSNHLLVRDLDGNLKSKWLHDVKEIQMNEEKGLTDKTVRKSDRIKVGRMIAMMLGAESPETGSPEQAVNVGLRKIRSKALNPEALRLVQKILDLAKQYDIKYDKSLVPAKLKEEKLPTVKKVDKSKKDNISNDILSPSDFRKLKKMSEEESPKGDTESDKDAEFETSPAHTEVGGLMNPPYAVKDDNLRRRKVNYQTEDVDATKKALAKAKMTADHEREKLALKKQHKREREMISQESTDAYGKSLQAIADKKKKDAISQSDKDKLAKLHQMMKNANNEEVDLEENAAVRKKASKSGVSYSTLMKVYRRGVAAWNSGHRPGTTPQQWGLARVNSYINKGKGTYHGADKDLREETLDEKMKRVPKDKESGEPKKYVAGLSKSTAKARAAHWDKMDKLDDRDPKAYEPAPGDATAKTKPSKHTIAYKKKFGEELELTDADLVDIVESLTDEEIFDEILEDIDVADIVLIDEEDGFEMPYEEDLTEEQMAELDEVLSRAGRIKAGINIRKTKAKRQRALKIALHRRATTKVTNKRAKRLAIKKLKARFLQGRPVSKLSTGEKERIERIVKAKGKLINRLALKMVPAVKKAEAYRLRKQ